MKKRLLAKKILAAVALGSMLYAPSALADPDNHEITDSTTITYDSGWGIGEDPVVAIAENDIITLNGAEAITLTLDGIGTDPASATLGINFFVKSNDGSTFADTLELMNGSFNITGTSDNKYISVQNINVGNETKTAKFALNLDQIADTVKNVNIASGSEMSVADEGTLNLHVVGDGKLKIDHALTLGDDADIATEIDIGSAGKLTADADNLTGEGTINNAGTITLTGGELTRKIEGNGGKVVAAGELTIGNGGEVAQTIYGVKDAISGETNINLTLADGSKVLQVVGEYNSTGNVSKASIIINGTGTGTIQKPTEGILPNYSVVGGYSVSGSASENQVSINGGSIEGTILAGGAYEDVGGASQNIVSVSGGTVSGKILAGIGYGSDSKEVKDNKVEISGGVLQNDITAGSATASSGVTVTGNQVSITGGTFIGKESTDGSAILKIVGATALSTNNNTELSGNSITITGGTFSVGKEEEDDPTVQVPEKKIGIYAAEGKVKVSGNSVTIGADDLSISVTEVMAGRSTGESGDVSGNILTIGEKTTVSGTLYGGYANNGALVQNNEANINGTVYGSVYGGYSQNASAGANTVAVTNGTVNGNIYGGYSVETSVSNNIIKVENSEVNGNICGGKGSSSTENKISLDNVTLKGTHSITGGSKNSGSMLDNDKNTLEIKNSLTIDEGAEITIQKFNGITSTGATITNHGELTFAEYKDMTDDDILTLDATIKGGVTNVNTNMKATGELNTEINISENIALTVDADDLTGESAIKNGGVINLQEGTLNREITQLNGTSGTVVIGAGDIIVGDSGKIDSNIEVVTGNKLTANADNLTQTGNGKIKNAGEIDLTGGELKVAVDRNGSSLGTVTISGEVSAAEKLSANIDVVSDGNLTINANKLGTDDGTVNNAGKITLTSTTDTPESGKLGHKIEGTSGTVAIAGNIEFVDVEVGSIIEVEEDGILKVNANKLTGTGDIKNAGEITLTGSVLNRKIVQLDEKTGTVKINSNFSVGDNGGIDANIELGLSGTLTANADNLIVNATDAKISNAGNLILTGGKLKAEVEKLGTNDFGNVIINDNAEVTFDNAVAAKIVIKTNGTLKTEAGNLKGDTIDNSNSGRIELTGTSTDSTTGILDAEITGVSGTVDVKGEITFNKAVKSKIEVEKNAKLITKAGNFGDNVATVINNAGEIKLTEGILARSISKLGTDLGKVTVNGSDVSVNSGVKVDSIIDVTADSKLSIRISNLEETEGAINNAGEITLTDGGILKREIGSLEGTTGIVKINSNVIVDDEKGKIDANIELAFSKTLKANANNLTADGTIKNAGSITLTGGDLEAAIEKNGSLGSVFIDGAVTAKKAIDATVTVNEGKSLTIDANNLAGNGAVEIQNNGKITLTGTTESGDTTGNLSKSISGTNGTVAVTGVITADTTANIASVVEVNKNGKLEINANNLTGTNKISNAGELDLTGGVLKNEVAQLGGELGKVTINGEVTANKAIDAKIDVNAGKSLQIDVSNLTGTGKINNDGTMTLTTTTDNKTLTRKIEKGDALGNVVVDGELIVDDNKGKIDANIELGSTAKLTANASNLTQTEAGTIKSAGTITLTGGELKAVVEKNGSLGSVKITGEVTADEKIDANITIDGTSGKLAIDANNLTTDTNATITNNGKLDLSAGTLAHDIAGNGTTKLTDDIKIGSNHLTIAGTLTADGKTIDLLDDGKTSNTLTIGKMTGTYNLKMDLDLSDSGSSDKFSVGADSSFSINLKDLRITGDADEPQTNPVSIYVSKFVIGTDNVTISGLGENNKLDKYTQDFEYNFIFDPNTKTLSYTSLKIDGLTYYIAGKINEFDVTKDIVIEGTGTDIATVDSYLIAESMERRSEVELDLKGFNLTGNSKNGITVSDNVSKLIVKGQGSGTDLSVISGFDKAFINNGNLEISNSVLQGNKVGVENIGTLDLNNVTFTLTDEEKGVDNSGTVNLSGAMTLELANTIVNSESGIVNVLDDVIAKTDSIKNGTINVNITDADKKFVLDANGATDAWNLNFAITESTDNAGKIIFDNGTFDGSAALFDFKEINAGKDNATHLIIGAETLGSNAETINVAGNSDVTFSKSTMGSQTLNVDVEGTGKTFIYRDIILAEGKKIGTALEIGNDETNGTGSLQANANQLIISDGLAATSGTIKNDGVLTLTGGELIRSVSGDGKVVAADALTIGENVKVEQTVYGSITNASGNTVDLKLKDGSEVQQVAGGYNASGDASGNKVNINISGDATGTGKITGIDDDDVWSDAITGGYALGGTSSSNEVNIIGGVIDEDVTGGFGENWSNENKVNVTGGTINKDLVGGEGSGTIGRNSVTIDGGKINSKEIYGGSGNNVAFSENFVEITGGEINNSSEKSYIIGAVGDEDNDGGVATTNSTFNNNYVEISGGKFTLAKELFVAGAYDVEDDSAITTTGTLTGNSVSITGGEFNISGDGILMVAGAKGTNGNLSNNNVSIENMAAGLKANVYGNDVTGSGNATGGTASIINSKITGNVYGASVNAGNAEGNKVDIKENSEITGNIYGGLVAGENAQAKNNIIAVDAGTITGNIYGGKADSANYDGEISGNTINVIKTSIEGNIYGGYSDVENKAFNNTVNLDKVTFDTGTYSVLASNNNLNVEGDQTGGAVNVQSEGVENKGSLTIGGGALNIDGNITGDSGTLILTSYNAVNNATITQTSLTNKGTLTTDLDDIVVTTLTNSGDNTDANNAVLNVTGGKLCDIEGAGTTVLQHSNTDVAINENITTIGGTLDINGHNLNMVDSTSENKKFETLTVGKLHGIGNLALELDLSVNSNNFDKVIATEGADDGTIITLDQFKIVDEDLTQPAGTVVEEDLVVVSVKNTNDSDKGIIQLSGTQDVDGNYYQYTDDYKYIFTLEKVDASGTNNYTLHYKRTDSSLGLTQYIEGEKEVYEVKRDTIIDSPALIGTVDKYLKDNNKPLRNEDGVILDLKGYDLIAYTDDTHSKRQVDGVNIGTEGYLIVKGQGTSDDISVIQKFKNAFDNSGILDVKDVKFKDNQIGIYNRAGGVVNLDNVEFEGNALAFSNYGTVNMKNMVLANAVYNTGDLDREGVINVQEGVTFKGIDFGTEKILSVFGGVVNIDSADGLTLAADNATDEYSVNFKLQKGANENEGILKVTNGVYKFNETVDVDGIELTNGTATFNKHLYDDEGGLVLGSNVKEITVNENSQVVLDGHKKADGGKYQNDTLTANVEGAGTLTIKSDVILQEYTEIKIINLEIDKDASLQAKADQLVISDGLSATNGTIKNEGVLTLAGGELKRSVAEGTEDDNVGKVVAAGTDKLTIGNGVQVSQTIYGGLESGSGNTVDLMLNDGSEVLQIIGGQSATGEASNNTVNLDGTGTITGLTDGVNQGAVYGGIGKGTISNNKINVSGGTFAKNIVGGQDDDDSVESTMTSNEITISGGSFGGDIEAVNVKKGSAKQNKVMINDGTFSGTQILGAEIVEGTGESNSIEIKGGTFSVTEPMTIAGAKGTNGNLTNNSVTIENISNELKANIYGNFATGGDVTNGTVSVANSKITGMVYGGVSESGKVGGSKVNITDSTITGDVVGGKTTSGNISNGTVTIKGSTVNGTICGGYAEGSATITGNVINVEDSTINVVTSSLASALASGNIYGGYSTGENATNNIINLNNVTFSEGDHNVWACGNNNVTSGTVDIKENGITNNGNLAVGAKVVNIGKAVNNKTMTVNGGTVNINGDITGDVNNASLTIKSNNAVNNAKITQKTLTNEGTLKTNLDDVIVTTLTNNNTLNVTGGALRDIEGTGTTVLGGKVTIKDDLDLIATISGTLNLNGEEINMQDGAFETVRVAALTGDGKVRMDVGLNTSTVEHDTLKVDGTGYSRIITLADLNLVSDYNGEGVEEDPSGNPGVLTYKGDVTDIFKGIALNNMQLPSDAAVKYTSGYKYTFTKIQGTTENDVSLHFVREESTAGLKEYIEGTISNFSVTGDTNLVGCTVDGALSSVRSDVQVLLNGYKLTDSNAGPNTFGNGITITAGHQLTVDGTGTNNSQITDFGKAFTNAGILNLSNGTIIKNKTGIENTGTVNLSKMEFKNNTYGIDNKVGGTVNLGEDVTFSENNMAVQNRGTLNITDGMTVSNYIDNKDGTINVMKDTTIKHTTYGSEDVLAVSQGTVNVEDSVLTLEGNASLTDKLDFIVQQKQGATTSTLALTKGTFDLKNQMINTSVLNVANDAHADINPAVTIGNNLKTINIDCVSGADDATKLASGVTIYGGSTGGTLKAKILGTGDAKIDGKLTLDQSKTGNEYNYYIDTGIDIVTTKGFNNTIIDSQFRVNADQLTGNDVIKNSGTLILTGGTLIRDVDIGTRYNDTSTTFEEGKVVVTEKVAIGGATVKETIYGSVDAYQNVVLDLEFVDGTTSQIKEIASGLAGSGAYAKNNTVTISGTGTLQGIDGVDGGAVNIYGGKGTANVQGNTVEVKDVTLKGNVYGGYGTKDISKNTVKIEDVTLLGGEIYGGFSTDANKAYDNTVEIKNVIVSSDSEIWANNGTAVSGSVNVSGLENNANLTLGGGKVQFNSDVTGTGDLTIDIKSSSVTENTAKITQNSVTNDGIFITNLNKFDVDTLTNNGTLNVTGGALRDIGGTGTTKLNNTVTVGAGANITGTLDLNGKEIDMQQPAETYTTLNVGTLKGKGNVKMDADLASMTYDKLIVTNCDSKAKITLSSLNLVSDSTADDGTLSDIFGNLPSANFTMPEDVKIQYTTYTGTGYRYVFTYDNGDLKFVRNVSTKQLTDYIEGTITEFSYNCDYIVDGNNVIGIVDNALDEGNKRSNVDLKLNGYNLTAFSSSESGFKPANGIVIKNGSQLTVDGMTSSADDGVNSVISKFDNAFVNEQGGTLNVSNVTFDGNKQAAKNDGTLNVSGTTTFKDSVSGNGVMKVAGNGTEVTVDGSDTKISNTIEVKNPAKLIMEDGTAGIVNNEGSVEFNGGKVSTLNNDGTVDINAVYNGTLNNNASGKVYVDTADNLGTAVVNNGMLEVENGGTLAKGMSGNGTLQIDKATKVTGNKVEQGKIVVKADADLLVGGDAQGIASANTTVLNGGTLEVKNESKNDLSNVSNYATGTTTLDGAYVVGKNGLLTLGSTDNNDAANFIARTNSNISWGSDVTGGVYIAKPINIAGGSVYVNDNGNSAGTLSLGDNALLMVPGNLGGVAVNKVSELKISDKAMIYLRGARTGQDIYITDAGADGINVDDLNLNGLGKNFKAEAINEDGKLKIHIIKGSLAVTQETVIPNIGNIAEERASGNFEKFMDEVSNLTDDASAINAVNAMANIGEVVGVEHNMVSLAHNFETSVFNRLSVTTRKPVERGGFYAGSSKIKLRNVMMDRNDHFDLGGIDSVSRVSTVRRGRVADLMPKRNNIEFSNRHYGEEIEKGIWAGLVKSKEKVEDLELGQIKSNYDANIKGATVGADLWSSETNVGGVAIIYADGDVTSNNGRVSTRSDVKYYGAGIYDRQDLPGNMALVVEANYVQGKNDIVQNNSNMEIKAKPKSQMANAGVRIEKMFGGERGHFVPYAGVQYSHLENESYKNSLDVKYSSKKMEIVSIPVGFRVGGSNQSESGWKVAPYAELGYIFNTGDIKNRLKVAYEGITDSFGYKVMDKGVFFTTAGFVICRDAYVIQLGYSYRKGKHTHDRKLTADVKFDF